MGAQSRLNTRASADDRELDILAHRIMIAIGKKDIPLCEQTQNPAAVAVTR